MEYNSSIIFNPQEALSSDDHTDFDLEENQITDETVNYSISDWLKAIFSIPKIVPRNPENTDYESMKDFKMNGGPRKILENDHSKKYIITASIIGAVLGFIPGLLLGLKTQKFFIDHDYQTVHSTDPSHPYPQITEYIENTFNPSAVIPCIKDLSPQLRKMLYITAASLITILSTATVAIIGASLGYFIYGSLVQPEAENDYSSFNHTLNNTYIN